MPKRAWVWVGPDHIDSDERPTKKRPVARGKKGKPVAPKWTADTRPGWSDSQPTGEWGKKCVETWCLLAPYDSTVTEEQWKKYYDERSALDRVNTLRRGGHSGPIESEDLRQPTWGILHESGNVVAAAIMGSAQLPDIGRKKRITHVLFGSLYFIRLDGTDEGNGPPEPRHIDVYSRLYSPFGIGTSVDFHYAYHYRRRFERQDDERFASLTARLRTIADCGAAPPNQSEDDEENAGPADAYVIFDSQEDGGGGLNTQFIDELTLKQFEKSLFGTEGWLSPRKMTDILLAGGSVLQYHEVDTEAAVSLLDKFQYFPGENTGKRALAPELKRLTMVETSLPRSDPVCIPQNRLLLARQG
ncbi:hypothetical protein RSOL_411760 [Rhizoctonia solani AG-3 Rhs1AP]|uniref:Uncharacterized protein n=2 Tax=Rhizoctonia solani AG-3 TaxID=1086053 RepID=A0A074S7X9_9AGAM|nr:hypothetical protein RSOL_411760 [Rhizoctonia solani AG-3 Rhs1AP]KEP53028.1 hypothetical protein V565_036830 [Rhizoctonia solani 123E]